MTLTNMTDELDNTDEHTREFARLNGWTWEHGKLFTMLQLAGRGRERNADMFPTWRSGADDPEHVMDHLFWFRKDRKPVAIVTMPYHAKPGAADKIAARYGLEAQSPPMAKGGWWLPGSTYCFAFVRPGTTVQWLKAHVT